MGTTHKHYIEQKLNTMLNKELIVLDFFGKEHYLRFSLSNKGINATMKLGYMLKQ